MSESKNYDTENLTVLSTKGDSYRIGIIFFSLLWGRYILVFGSPASNERSRRKLLNRIIPLRNAFGSRHTGGRSTRHACCVCSVAAHRGGSGLRRLRVGRPKAPEGRAKRVALATWRDCARLAGHHSVVQCLGEESLNTSPEVITDASLCIDFRRASAGFVRNQPTH